MKIKKILNTVIICSILSFSVLLVNCKKDDTEPNSTTTTGGTTSSTSSTSNTSSTNSTNGTGATTNDSSK
ncbi:MAG: hypothetical protein K0S32_3968 [Bacteroidetes bacterium]|nr:hypothetical protein [Bacteroidota bacterium]